MTTTPTDEGFVDPTTLGGDVNSVIAALTSDADTKVAPIPDIPEQPDTFLTLPAGLELPDGGIVRDVEIRELTGEHEERIARVRQGGDFAKFFQTLLECGVEKIGTQEATPDLLKNLLVGDREFLMLGIREATYGPEVDYYGEVHCTNCGENFPLKVDIREVPIRPLDAEGREFKVTLRKGSVAEVRLPNGADSEFWVGADDLTDAERTTALLQRCVTAITDTSGERHVIAVFPQLIRTALGAADRRTLTKAINDRQPGPLYDEVKYTHTCGNVIDAPMGLMHMFPGM